MAEQLNIFSNTPIPICKTLLGSWVITKNGHKVKVVGKRNQKILVAWEGKEIECPPLMEVYLTEAEN
jgi:hypothetical protein